MASVTKSILLAAIAVAVPSLAPSPGRCADLPPGAVTTQSVTADGVAFQAWATSPRYAAGGDVASRFVIGVHVINNRKSLFLLNTVVPFNVAVVGPAGGVIPPDTMLQHLMPLPPHEADFADVQPGADLNVYEQVAQSVDKNGRVALTFNVPAESGARAMVWSYSGLAPGHYRITITFSSKNAVANIYDPAAKWSDINTHPPLVIAKPIELTDVWTGTISLPSISIDLKSGSSSAR